MNKAKKTPFLLLSSFFPVFLFSILSFPILRPILPILP